MLPSLIGIIASSGGAVAGGDYESIATVTVGSGGAATVTFSSIPSTYQHLEIRYIARSAGTTANRININVNGDTSSTFYWHSLYGTGSSAAAYSISTAYIQVAPMPVSTDTASAFTGGVTSILDYANTNKYKTFRTLAGDDLNGSGLLFFNSGAWSNTNAITSLSITPNAANNFAQYSSFALYGIKG